MVTPTKKQSTPQRRLISPCHPERRAAARSRTRRAMRSIGISQSNRPLDFYKILTEGYYIFTKYKIYPNVNFLLTIDFDSIIIRYINLIPIRQARLPQGYGLLPQNSGDTMSWSTGYVESRHNLTPLHRPAKLKLKRYNCCFSPAVFIIAGFYFAYF